MLAEQSRNQAKIWREVDRLRTDLRDSGKSWPAWCYFPACSLMAHVQAESHLAGVLPRGEVLPPATMAELQSLALLATWRVSQGIYRYHPELLAALWDTPVDGQIPRDVLLSLPEWCVYVETPDRSLAGDRLHGFFACWDYVNESTSHLRLGLDLESHMMILPLDMSASVVDALLDLDRDYREYVEKYGDDEYSRQARAMAHYSAADIAPLVSTLLYLCSVNAEVADRTGRRPRRAQPVKTKDGPRFFPPDKPASWDVGFRIGAAIQAAKERQPAKAGDGTHASPRPHIRRAHWHSFWTGLKAKVGVARETERKLILKWLPPIAVNLDEGRESVPTIHGVRKTQ